MTGPPTPVMRPPVTRPALARAVDTRLAQLLNLAWARLGRDATTIPRLAINVPGQLVRLGDILPGNPQ